MARDAISNVYDEAGTPDGPLDEEREDDECSGCCSSLRDGDAMHFAGGEVFCADCFFGEYES